MHTVSISADNEPGDCLQSFGGRRPEGAQAQYQIPRNSAALQI